MTQGRLYTAETISLTARVIAYFKARPNLWIDGVTLEPVGGKYAWRSRVSDARRRGIVIENRQRRIKRADGSKFVISEYRYVA